MSDLRSMRDADFSTPQATHPVPVRIANALGGPLTRRVDLSSDAIVARALRSLPDAAESDIEFRPALDALCHSLQHETDFNVIGRTSAKGDTVRLLQTQIRINQLLRSRPEILETELPRPIYVIGLPRSGTTILHSLLAQDPEHRALRYFEGFDPTLPATRDVHSRQKLGKMLAGLEYVSPSYRAIHAMDADSIEECVTVMYHSFSTIQMEFQYECPSYLRFLEDQGTNAPYAYYRKQLQLLQFHRPHGKRWVLKDPAHLVALDTLQELFPDASFVWIHRDPARVLSSIASLTAYTRAIFSDHYDAESIGRTVTDGVWPRALARGLELREQLPEDRFVDLRYSDFVADPIASLERVYEQLNLTFTAAARSAMAEYLRAHSQHSEGAHRHSLEQFGIDPASESRRHASYRERFDIPREI